MSNWSNRDIFLSFQPSRCGVSAIVVAVPVERVEEDCCCWLWWVIMERRVLECAEVVSEWLVPMLLGLKLLG